MKLAMPLSAWVPFAIGVFAGQSESEKTPLPNGVLYSDSLTIPPRPAPI